MRTLFWCGSSKFRYCHVMWSGLQCRSRGRSWSRSESTILPGVRVGAGVGKILPTPTPVRSRKLPTVNTLWFWPNGYASSRKHWKTWRKLEKQRTDKVKVTFSDRTQSDKEITDNFRVIATFLWLCKQTQGLSLRSDSSKTAITTADCFHSLHDCVM